MDKKRYFWSGLELESIEQDNRSGVEVKGW